MSNSNVRILSAEAIGTMILMLGGPGTAILGINTTSGGHLAVALGFGFALLVAAYAIGHISGCHINPAVTIGLWVMKKVDAAKVPVYIAGQVVGAAAGGVLIWLIAESADGNFKATPGTFATNLWDTGHGFAGFGPMVVAEITMTALLIFAVLSSTRRGYTPGVVGLHVGITLALIHMISIPIDNTSVNPARSFGTAIVAGGDALEQLWAFVVFPIVGAVVGALLWLLVDDADLEDTALAGSTLGRGLTGARDAMGTVTGKVTDRLDGLDDEA